MLENNFRSDRQFIKETLVGSFTSNNFDINNYVKTSIPHEWVSKSLLSKVHMIDSSDYEKTLVLFMEDETEIKSHPSLIIVGDIGTGKSSSIKFAETTAKKCHNCTPDTICKRNPMIIHFDFLQEDFKFKHGQENERGQIRGSNEVDETVSERTLTMDGFWKVIFRELDKLIEVDESTERKIFWPWLLTDYSEHLPINLYRNLSFFKEQIIKGTLKNKDYETLRKAIYLDSQTEDFATYRMMEIAFCRREHNGKCNLVVFDNIDSLEPDMQRKVLEISSLMNNVLPCKSIIPMRPHTFSINNDASTFSEVLVHWAPNIFDVIHKRILNMIKVGGKAEIYGNNLLEAYNFIITQQYRKDIFIITCGLSIRFALRNFYNFVLSPLIFWEHDKAVFQQLELSHLFYQAYFCSEIPEQYLYENNFINLFSLQIQGSVSFYSNIKLRILYLLSNVKDSGMSVNEVHQQMLLFGYNKTQICSAINDMMRRRTALIWSDTKISYTEDSLTDTHTLSLSPIGVNYYKYIIHLLYYVRECITAKDKNREIYQEVWVQRCWDVLRDLENDDYKEILTYITNSNSSIKTYQRFYGEVNSISLILFKALKSSFIYHSNKTSIVLDTDRDNIIKSKIIYVLKNHMLPEGLVF